MHALLEIIAELMQSILLLFPSKKPRSKLLMFVLLLIIAGTILLGLYLLYSEGSSLYFQ